MRQFASAGTALVAFSANGKRLVAAAGEHTVHVWDWPAIKPPRTLLRPDDIPSCTAVAPDGKTLASGTGQAGLLLRNLDSGDVQRPKSNIVGAVQEIAFSADSKLYATFGLDCAIRLWNGSEKPVWSEMLVDTRAASLAFAGNRLLAGCDDDTIHIWDLEKGKSLPSLKASRIVREMAVSADGRTVFVQGAGQELAAWDLTAGRVVRTLEGHTETVKALACTPDGRRLASAGLDGGIRLWDVESGEELARLGSEDRLATALAFAPGGRVLIVATPDSYLDQWDLDTLEKTPLLAGHREEIEAVAFVDGGKHVQTWSASESRLWQTATGKPLGTVKSDKPVLEKLITSPGGHYRVSVDFDKSVFPLLVSTETGKEVELAGLLRSVRAAAFSPDDKILAAAGSDGNVTLWETSSGQIFAEFKAHEGRVSCIAFSSDGRTFVTGGSDASVVIWSLTACGPALDARWRNPSDDDLEALWKALWAEKGADAFEAMRALTAAPKKAVPFVRKKLPPALDLRRTKKLIADLDDDEFDKREKASQELEQMGHDAEQSLRDALSGKPSAEMKRRITELLSNLKGDDSPRVRGWSRAVFVLEHIGTPEARDVLKLLAEGDRVAKAAEDARAALKRK